jgi:hypothetical protein
MTAAPHEIGAHVQSRHFKATTSHIATRFVQGGHVVSTQCNRLFSVAVLLWGDEATLPLCSRCAHEYKGRAK